MAGHRRRISKFQKQEKQTKLKRMKSKVLNWINGHPVTEDPLSEETKVKNNSKLFRRKQLEETDSRMIFVNRAVTEDQPNFPLNKIRTAKYKVHTFLVKNLFEQFRRVANFYFLTLVLPITLFLTNLTLRKLFNATTRGLFFKCRLDTLLGRAASSTQSKTISKHFSTK